ncbi:DUF835 domain-containing protein [Deltaproteobacteria bacterium]|nr:DUF835 domain-containing protein [Deltaproteobacteria bacterium]
MVELPSGNIEETRRGGPDVLQVMVQDLVSSSADGYIRSERKPESSLPRIGYLVFREGQPAMALHEGEIIRLGLDALMELEEDAMSIEALLTLHQEVDTRTIIELHSEAILHLDKIEERNPDSTNETLAGEWWNEERIQSLSWRKATDLPDLIPSMQAPEFIRRIGEARIERNSSEGTLMGGHLHLIDCQEVNLVMKLAGELNRRGRPLISISRLRVEKQLEFYQEEGNTCFWLVERPEDAEHIGPSLEGLLRLIEGWLEEHRSAVILFDGFEFLSGTHGDSRTIGFLRRLADLVRDSDDIMLMPVILDSWEEIIQNQLLRATDPLSTKLIEEWLIDPDVLDDHPFMELVLDDSEAAAVEAALNQKLGVDEEIPVSGHGSTPTTGTSDDTSLDELMKGWAKESAVQEDGVPTTSTTVEWKPSFHSGATGEQIETTEEHIEEQVEEEVVQIVDESIQPRTAVKRKRRVKKPITKTKVSPQSILKAVAAKEVSIAENIPESNIILTDELRDASCNATEKELELPEIKKSPRAFQKALEAGSEQAGTRIDSSKIPELIDAQKIKTHIDSWNEAAEQNRAKNTAEWPSSTDLDDIVSRKLQAATEAAINPSHLDESRNQKSIGPMKARPGSELKNKINTSKGVQERRQRASDPATIERKVREEEMKAYREFQMEGKISRENLPEVED